MSIYYCREVYNERKYWGGGLHFEWSEIYSDWNSEFWN